MRARVLTPCAGDNQVLAAKLGAVEVVVELMKRHTGEVKLLTKAAGALWNLAVNGSPQQLQHIDMQHQHADIQQHSSPHVCVCILCDVCVRVFAHV